jgi:hypothetical protein
MTEQVATPPPQNGPDSEAEDAGVEVDDEELRLIGMLPQVLSQTPSLALLRSEIS